MKRFPHLLVLVFVSLGAGVRGELPIAIDGYRDPLYGPPVAVQTVQVDADEKNNELDAAYVAKDSEFLHLLLTGNLETDFSRLEIFIDCFEGGQNQILGNTNPNNDNWAARFNLFTFDPSFFADFLIIVRHGFNDADEHLIDVDFATLGGEGAKVGSFNTGLDPSTGPFVCDNGIELGLDNSNTGGVSVGTGAADPDAASAVETGIELRIPLSLIGAGEQEIKISAFINNPDHIYLYNQFLGGMPPGTGKLGSNGEGVFFGGTSASLFLVDLDDFEGDQYFVVPPFRQPLAISDFTVDFTAGEIEVIWDSSFEASYTLERYSETIGWSEVTDGIESGGVSTSYVDGDAPLDEKVLLYRVIEE